MGEPLCQPLCILHDFNKCFVNICICICDCVFCKQTCRKAGEDRICILIAFVFQKYEKAQQAFCVQYWFPKSSHQKPTFCKISNLLCLLKSPISIECAKSDRLSPAWADTGGYLLPAAYWVPSPPSVELESDPAGQQHCEPPLPQCCVMLYSWLAWSSAASFGQTWVESPYSAQLHSCLWSPPQIGALLRVWHQCHRHFEE